MADTRCPKTANGRHMWRDIGTKDDAGGKDVRCMVCGAPRDDSTFGHVESPLKRP